MPEGAIYVGRPSRWGNPFVVGRDGTRAECVERYKMLLAGYLCISESAEHVAEQERVLRYARKNISKLRGHDLACWCRLDGKPCHADVLLEVANK